MVYWIDPAEEGGARRGDARRESASRSIENIDKDFYGVRKRFQ